MIETLTMAVIVLAISLVGLALLYSILLSDQNKRIQRIREEVEHLKEIIRDEEEWKLLESEEKWE